MFTNRADQGPVVASTPISDDERQRFVDDLLDYMTLEEKAGQLVALPQAPDPTQRRGYHDGAAIYERLREGLIGAVGGVADRAQAEALQQIAIEESRLGIPLLIIAETGNGVDTIMPAPAAAAASWDPAAIETAERITADEARARGVNWSLSPQIRLAADCAQLEFAQSSGSDAFLASRIAVARIRGLQHDVGEHECGMIASLGLAKDALTPPLSKKEGAASALPLVLDAIREGRAASIAIEASPAEEREPHPGDNRHALNHLRRPGSYSGMLLSVWADLAAIAGQAHLDHGFMNLSPERLVASVRGGDIAEAQINEAVRRVLAVKFDLGLFRSPFRRPNAKEEAIVLQPGRAREAALELARRSVVLLRNSMALLPIGPDSREILVVGTAATDRELPLGGHWGEAVSVIDGLEHSGVRHKYVPGLALRQQGTSEHGLIDADRMAIGMACEAARNASEVVVVLGHGVPGARLGALGEAPRQLLSALRAVNERIVLVTLGARPINPAIDGEPLPCVLHGGQLGTLSGLAIADVLAGKFGPVGRLPAPLTTRDPARSLPFGYGLGYGDFTQSNFAIDMAADRILASLDLRNDGELAGSETIQLYIRRCDGPLSTKTGKLCGFVRATLQPEDRTRVRFEIGANHLGHYSDDGRFVIEEGRYEIQLGPDSARLQCADFTLSAALAAAMRGVLTGREQLQAHDTVGLRRA